MPIAEFRANSGLPPRPLEAGHEVGHEVGHDAAAPLLELRGVTKAYPGVIANDAIDLTIMPHRIHALLGENGAGKSTLMKLIYGVTEPDAGEIRWRGAPMRIASPAHARELGIGMVFQHFSLFETLTVVENVSLAVPGGRAELADRIEEIGGRFGLAVDPGALVHSLSVGERQRVEIIRCLLQEPDLLILDEPTSVLSPQSIEPLFETLRLLAREKCAIVYISHKLEEVRSLCQQATILRRGRVAGTADPARESAKSLARMMIGRDIPRAQRRGQRASGGVALRVSGLCHESDDPFGTAIEDMDLEVRAGEIVGIAGVSGNGQNELVRLISGETRLPAARADVIAIDGGPAGHFTPRQRRDRGLAFVPEERLGRGAVPAMSLTRNAVLTGHRSAMVRWGLVDYGRAERFARRCIETFKVKCGGPGAEAGSLSGGNLQKFIVGREMLLEPRIILVSQPTWGVDVGAAAEIRQRLIDLAEQGVAVLVVSEELEELFEISDRLAVISQGRLSPLVDTDRTSMEEIGTWMTGCFPGGGGGVQEETA